jgi:PPE-repeat protein
MALDFSWLPPEINSARIFAGAGSGPLFMAATAWDGLAEDLQGSASSFQSVVTGLAAGPWSGPASASMAAAAAPYVGWLSAAAAQAASAAGQARAAATAFEAALTATVHPAAVTSNRMTLMTLIATNFFGINAPAIAANEFMYVEMWAQDVAAMVGYHAGATSVAATLSPFSLPPASLAGLTGWMSQVGSELSGLVSTTGLSQVGSALSGLTTQAGLTAAVGEVQSAVSAVPLSELQSVAQIAMYPASMMMSPMMSLAQMGGHAAPAVAGASELGADMPKFVGSTVPDMKPLGGLGGGGLGSGMSGGLGHARLVGAMSVPPTWQGSMPSRMVSTAMSGMGGMPAEMAAAGAPGGGGGMPMMPMPMGGGAGGGMPGGMMGRGGASPNMVQNRPSVVPRIGVG